MPAQTTDSTTPGAAVPDDPSGHAPQTSPVAVLLVDVINDLEFPGADEMFAPALNAARALATFKARAKAAGVPVIYANDNFGRWRSDLPSLVARCLKPGVRGRPIVELLRPDADDYAVLKPRHSAFFATPLELLLAHLGTRRLVIGGYAGDMCVQFTAQDAFMRGLEVVVPRDGLASVKAAHTEAALTALRRTLNADTTALADLDLDALLRVDPV